MPRQQLVQSGGGVVSDAAEHVGKLGTRIDVIQACGYDEVNPIPDSAPRSLQWPAGSMTTISPSTQQTRLPITKKIHQSQFATAACPV